MLRNSVLERNLPVVHKKIPLMRYCGDWKMRIRVTHFPGKRPDCSNSEGGGEVFSLTLTGYVKSWSTPITFFERKLRSGVGCW